jgi:hypothetical protein
MLRIQGASRHVVVDLKPAAIAAMLEERVALGPAGLELVRVSHANEIRRDAPVTGRQGGDDVPPEVGRRGVAVQEDQGISPAEIHVGELPSIYVSKFLQLPSGHGGLQAPWKSAFEDLETRGQRRVTEGRKP